MPIFSKIRVRIYIAVYVVQNISVKWICEQSVELYIQTPREVHSIKQRNPDICSVFRNELIAIDMVLEKIMNKSNYKDLWILSDNRSSIQHLKNWAGIEDKISLSILRKVKLISHHHKVHFQWIPSHAIIYVNELVDTLAKEVLDHPVPSTSKLAYLELFSKQKTQNKAK
ncbi:RNase H domain-containing protein [Trichonephila clavipes]|nr:RNase H domain-containing protein [Trichonephila clavipes]